MWPQDLYEVLTRCVGDRGERALEEVDTLAREADGLEITVPTYAALTAWGDAGLQRMVAIAVAGSSVRSKSGALTLLSALAATGQLPTNLPLPVSDTFLADLNRHLPENAAQSSRRALRDLVATVPADDLFIPISQSFMHLSFGGGEVHTGELMAALATRWFLYGLPALEEYERLIRERPGDEPSFQEFFCRYPQLLDPMAVHLWSQPDFHGAYEPDFVVRRADDSYLVVEIETPGKAIMTAQGRPSAFTTHAESQVLGYEAFLSERVLEARTHFPGFSRAECLVVIGRESALTERQSRGLRLVNNRRQDLRIAGFDWLHDRARTILSNISDNQVAVTRGHRLI